MSAAPDCWSATPVSHLSDAHSAVLPTADAGGSAGGGGGGESRPVSTLFGALRHWPLSVDSRPYQSVDLSLSLPDLPVPNAAQLDHHAAFDSHIAQTENEVSPAVARATFGLRGLSWPLWRYTNLRNDSLSTHYLTHTHTHTPQPTPPTADRGAEARGVAARPLSSASKGRPAGLGQ